jgi:transcription elongation factor SPT5
MIHSCGKSESKFVLTLIVSDLMIDGSVQQPGKERDLVFSLMRKAIDKEFSARPLQIMSAFYRDSLPGMIYVEARSEPQVLAAVQGLIGVYASRGTNLVPIDEMASLLRIKKQQSTVTVGSWVRVKKGKYTGDLAQVTGVTDNGEMAELKLVPRIDLTPKEGGDGRKRKKTTSGMPLNFRPPPRFFNPEEINKVYGTRAGARRQGQKWLFNGEEFVGGYLQKDHRITAISTENVNPTLDEITAFTAVDRESNENGTDPNIDLSVIANAARKAATIVLQPGDQVEVFEGEQTGVHGVVDSIRGDIAVLRAKNIELEGQKIEVPAASVRKRFNPGDHVKVMAGTNADETGLVVSVSKDVVTIWSDLSNAEVSNNYFSHSVADSHSK